MINTQIIQPKINRGFLLGGVPRINSGNSITAGLVGAYSLGLCGGYNLVGSSIPAIFIGSPPIVSTVRGLACSLNGSTQYISLSGLNALVDLSKAITVSLWFKTTSYTSLQTIFCIGSTTLSNVLFLLDYGTSVPGIRLFRRDSVATSVSASLAVGSKYADGNWHHLVGVSLGNAARIALFVDGVILSSAAGTLAVVSTTGANIGSRVVSPAGTFNGAVDNILIFARALLDAEVFSLFSNPYQAFILPEDAIASSLSV